MSTLMSTKVLNKSQFSIHGHKRKLRPSLKIYISQKYDQMPFTYMRVNIVENKKKSSTKTRRKVHIHKLLIALITDQSRKIIFDSEHRINMLGTSNKLQN